MFKRITCNIVLFLGIFFLPWWGTVALTLIFMVFFRRFWEGVVAMLFLDSLYFLPTASTSWQIYGRFGIFTVSAVIFLFFIKNFKTKIRFNL